MFNYVGVHLDFDKERERGREVVKILIGAKANVNHADFHNVTALMKAAHFGDTIILEMLLEANAKVSPGALDAALRHGHAAAARVLIKAGALFFLDRHYGLPTA